MSDAPESVPVETPVEESPVETPAEEAPVEAPVDAPAEDAPAEAPAEEAPAEAPSEAPADESAPVEEAPVEEAPAETPAEEPAPIEEAPAEEPVEEKNTKIIHDNMCSLKTLISVLGKWSGNEIKKRQVEDLLKEGTEVDENLDDIEKMVEVLKLWIKEGPNTFREHNHFKNLDEYTLTDESRNLSDEKKLEVLKTVTELTVNVSQRKVTDEEINNVINSLY